MRRKFPGLKYATEAMELQFTAVGRRAFCKPLKLHCEVYKGIRNENAGMSSDNADEKPAHRKSKVSWARLILPG